MESVFRFIIYLLIVLTTLSCNVAEIETELDIPYKGDLFVLHGYIDQGEGVGLFVQKTIPHSCTNCNDSVSNAVVSLYENGAYLFDLNTDDGYWYYSQSSFLPVIGNEYQIKTQADKMPTAISSSVGLIQNVAIDTAYIETSDNPYRVKINYRFDDIPNERNHYLARVVAEDAERYMLNNHSTFNLLIGDEVAKNGTIEGELIYYLNDEHDEVTVILYHLSPSLVQYIYSREENFFTEDDPFSEYPVPVFSNISNGYGYWGAFATDRYTIRF